jgi:hypothetical protein
MRVGGMSRALLAALPDSFALPLRGKGLAAFAGGSILPGIASSWMSRPYIGCVIIPYVYAYAARMLHAAVDGEREAPDSFYRRNREALDWVIG